jgi:hypothetical protein
MIHFTKESDCHCSNKFGIVNYKASIILYFEISFHVLVNFQIKYCSRVKYLISLSAKDKGRKLPKRNNFIDGCTKFGAATDIIWFRALRLTLSPLELALWPTMPSLELIAQRAISDIHTVSVDEMTFH